MRLERVGNRLQMPSRQMQVDGRVIELSMAEQHLNGPQVGAGFQQVGGEAVPQRVRRDALLDAGRASPPRSRLSRRSSSVIGTSARQLFSMPGNR